MSDASETKTEAADVSALQIAKVYAKALLAATEKAAVTEATLEEFAAIVHDALDRNPRFEAVVSSGLIDESEKSQLLDRVFGGKVSALLLNFLKVLARHGRLDLMRAVYQAALAGLDDLRGRVKVEVRSAAGLDAAAAAHIATELQHRLGIQPRLEVVQDPSLIAGLVLRVGDTVYDGSVATQLKHVRSSMIHRSVHEIQGRRDRFRHSGGD
jgi:F-type H+-transporting ATPase subunit delta